MSINDLQKVAQIVNPALNRSLQNQTGSQFFGRLIPALIALGFVIGTVTFFFIFIMGAIQWITSGGDKSSVESARSRIINALVGITILFSLYAIIKFIQYFFKINILSINIGALKI